MAVPHETATRYEIATRYATRVHRARQHLRPDAPTRTAAVCVAAYTAIIVAGGTLIASLAGLAATV